MFVTSQLSKGRDTGTMLLIGVDLDAHHTRIRTRRPRWRRSWSPDCSSPSCCPPCSRGWWPGRLACWPTPARQIADRGDYSIRAASRTGDEIGVLVQAFNRMLDEIQQSQRERAGLLDREQQANRLKDEFLATLSHELRTPLNAIVGWVHLLRRGQLPAEEVSHALERIDRNAHAQARLVQDLLDVSRITSGKLLLDIREMDLATVALNAIDACRPAAEARQVSLVTEFGGTFPTMGDPDRLQQVLWNLITNAVRFTPVGRQRDRVDRARGGRRHHRGARYRRRHRAAIHSAHVRAVPPGRRRQHTLPRRPRAGPDDRAPPDRDAWRHRVGGERWRGQGRNADGEPAGAPPRAGGNRAVGPAPARRIPEQSDRARR
jgi:hypothetical protein